MSLSDTPTGTITRLRSQSKQTRSDEQRRHPRIPAQQEASLYWTDYLGVPHEETITIVNVSASGVAFTTAADFRVGHAVTIRSASGTLDCTVRRVGATEEPAGGYCIGVEVMHSSNGTDIQTDLRNLAAVGRGDRSPAANDPEQGGGRP